MLAAKAELDRAEPEIPIFEAEPHAFIEASTLVEYGPPHEATRLAEIFLQMTKR